MRGVVLFISMMIYLTSCFAGIKAILFDCDGTLVDSDYAHYVAWKKALNEVGCDLALEDYYQYAGKPSEITAKLLAESKGMDCSESLFNTKREYYRTLSKAGLPPIADTIDFLKAIALKKKSLGIKLGVCSASRKEEILSHLRHLGIEEVFDVVLSGQEDLHEYSDPEGINKPKPYIYLHAMKVLGVAPEDTIVVEDSTTGSLAGVAAGCFTIAIPNAYTKHHDFSHAHWQLESFSEVTIDDFLHQVKKMQTLQSCEK